MKRVFKIKGYLQPKSFYVFPGGVYSYSADSYIDPSNPDRGARFVSDICSEAGSKACGAVGCGFSSGRLTRITSSDEVRISYDSTWRNALTQEGEGRISSYGNPEEAVRVDPVYIGWAGSEAFCWRGDCGNGMDNALAAVVELGESDGAGAEYEVKKPDFDGLRKRNRVELLEAAVALAEENYLLAAYVDPLYLGRYLEEGDLNDSYNTLYEIRHAKLKDAEESRGRRGRPE